MKVFRISTTKPYSGGSALVAANNVEEAIKLFCEENYRKYEYEEGKCKCNNVANMNYDVNKPSVIFDDLYIE